MYCKKRFLPARNKQYESVYKFRGTIPLSGNETNLKRVVADVLNFWTKTYDIAWPEEATALKDHVCVDNDMKCRGEIHCIMERSLWAMHLKYYDAESTGRWFLHDISIVGDTEHLKFGYSVCAECRNTRPHFSPKLIWTLADQCDLMQQVKLNTGVLNIHTAMQLHVLLDLLEEVHRTLPVVIVSEISTRDAVKGTRYVVDAANLAFRLRGYAHVVQLSFEASKEFTTQLGRSWAVFDGCVRIFYPEFDPEHDLSSAHPGFFREQINSYAYSDKQGPDAFGFFLQQQMKIAVADLFVDWDGLYFTRETKRLKHELEFFFHWIDEHTAKNTDELEKQNQELTARLELATELLRKFQDEPNPHPETEVSSEGSGQKKQQGENPTSYQEIPSWVHKQFAGKLLLLPRAERAVEKGKYFSIEIVCEALRLLAHEYRNSRLGLEPDSAFREGCQKYQLAFCGSLRCPKAKEARETYFVNYPDGDNRCQLKLKLQRGNSRDRKYCLRIYFFWDESNQLVVVGYMPDHLPNSLT